MQAFEPARGLALLPAALAGSAEVALRAMQLLIRFGADWKLTPEEVGAIVQAAVPLSSHKSAFVRLAAFRLLTAVPRDDAELHCDTNEVHLAARAGCADSRRIVRLAAVVCRNTWYCEYAAAATG